MKLEIFEGKSLEEAKNKALEKLNVEENEILIKSEEKKGKLFKSASFIVKVIKISDVANYIKDKLDEILKNMNISGKYESSIRDEQINIKIYSDKNNILIGKNGQNLKALQTILRQIVYKDIDIYPYILLDVANYKEKKINNLERSAKRIAKEVQKTKVAVSLDNMNSYERRIIHNALSNFKNISTTSEGEEPNRHIVISHKED